MQNRARMLFENLQSFLLARDKEMDCIPKTRNQKPELCFMVFHEAHGCGQCHAAYHGHGVHADQMGAGSFCASVVGNGDESSREFTTQHAIPTFLRGPMQFHKATSPRSASNPSCRKNS